MLSWSCPHTSRWLSLILFSSASTQRLPLLQSLEAASMSQSSTFSLDDSESKEVWSLVLFELPATVPSSRLTVALVGLEEGLTGSCPCCSKMVPVPNINSCIPSPPSAELYSLPVLTSWGSTQVLFLWWWSSEPLEEQPHFLCVEMARNSANGYPTRGVPKRGDLAGEVAGEEEC